MFFKTIFAGLIIWLLVYNIGSLIEKNEESNAIIQPYLTFLMKEEYMEEIELEKVKDENEENLRVLVPVVIYGPNNQYQGFRESIMIAKILNRKVDFN